MVNPKIFKRYDIRGKFLEDIDDNVVTKLIQAYVNVFNPNEVIIGHDSLDGSTQIYPHVCEEFLRLNVDVNKIGMVTTPMLYFASAFYKVSHGIMITASHLGPGHTGMKIVIDNIPPTPEQIIELRDNILNQSPNRKITRKDAKTIEKTKILEDYKTKLLKLVPKIKNPKRYKIVADACNGSANLVVNEIFDKLSLDYEIINMDIKGDDLAHDTNPKVESSRKQLAKKVVDTGSDIGIIWDGDVDRAYFVDWEGEIIQPEYVGSVIAKYLIKKGLGSKITSDVRASNALEDEIKKAGGEVLRLISWHIPIKMKMIEDKDVVFGMETSGHYVFRDFYRIDDGLLASVIFIAAISNQRNKIQTELERFRKKYLIFEEINFKTSKTEKELVEEFKEMYRDADFEDLDGITIEYPDWRFNVRASRTEPIIRLNISGTNRDKVWKNLEILKNRIGGHVI